MGIIKNPQSNLPPGFRFHPTDEELILHYLKKKITSSPFPLSIIADVDIYKFNPWDLPAKAAFGEKEWYFFSPRDRKYPNGARPNRAAASGYWKATGTDKIIVASSSSMSGGSRGGGNGGGGGVQENLGVKKALVFYKGRPPKGIKTNWIMHEYRLADSPTSYGHKPINKPKDSSSTSTMRLDDWVLCRIYKKTHASPPSTTATAASDQDQELEEDQEEHQSMLQQTINKNPMILPQKSSSFSNLLDAMDYSFLSSILADNNQFNQTGFDSLNPSLPYTTNATLIDQPFSTTTSYCNTSTGFTKLPGLNSTTTSFMPDNQLKRPLFTMDEETDTKRRNNTTTEEEFSRNASKALVNCCSYTNSSTQSDHVAHQYNFLNQQLLLSPHLQFQG